MLSLDYDDLKHSPTQRLLAHLQRSLEQPPRATEIPALYPYKLRDPLLHAGRNALLSGAAGGRREAGRDLPENASRRRVPGAARRAINTRRFTNASPSAVSIFCCASAIRSNLCWRSSFTTTASRAPSARSATRSSTRCSRRAKLPILHLVAQPHYNLESAGAVAIAPYMTTVVYARGAEQVI